jgi:uncharacterized Zn-finger protein
MNTFHRNDNNLPSTSEDESANKKSRLMVEVSDDTAGSSGLNAKKYICTKCNTSFSRSDNLKRHVEKRCKSLFPPKNKNTLVVNVSADVPQSFGNPIPTTSGGNIISQTLPKKSCIKRK